MKYCFGDIVVVNGEDIGVIVKSWLSQPEITHEVYIRNENSITTFKESDIERYMVRHKELNDEEKEYQYKFINDTL